MGKFDRIVDIVKSPKTLNNWRLATEELEERFNSLHRTVSYLSAKEGLDQLKAGIPGGSEYKDLRGALRISEIGGRKGEGAYSINAPVKSRRVRKIDVQKTVVYVRAKKRAGRPDPAIQLLEDRGPWTADTIPFWPTKREAVVVQRKVTKKEADRVAKEQKPKLDAIIGELLNMGRRIKKPKAGEPGHVKRGGKAVPDVGMVALDLEFGGNGKRSKPVFRKMIRSTIGGIGKMMGRNKIIEETVSDPNSKRYKSYPPRVDKISQGEAKKFSGFQKRLGR